MEKLRDKIKNSLRIKNDSVNSEIEDYIEACKLDLKRMGVVKIGNEDHLIIQAIKLYVKWQMNFEGESERYMNAYTMLGKSLALCGDYNV